MSTFNILDVQCAHRNEVECPTAEVKIQIDWRKGVFGESGGVISLTLSSSVGPVLKWTKFKHV